MNWPYRFFKPNEVLSPDGLSLLESQKWSPVPKFAMEAFSDFRDWIDVPISVNYNRSLRRGYRSNNENKQVGGARNSTHLLGLAFDQTPHNYPLFDFFCQAILWSKARFEQGKTGFSALGIYPQKNFMHGDFRYSLNENLIIWNGFKNKALTIVVQRDSIPVMNLDEWLKAELMLPEHWQLEKSLEELKRGL